ncbi:hypothetical protein PTTG_05165 [Puccinia triticina 1-1 BBBD Race 1]|uniref:Uncharacterized protein n=1 Tax=Puccinia triticina (isolate 1-1 / race 1 (BBBD)) TaxID=630390 RepID=A0A180G133_PUCT1|nr:hypothetical protein PTTG_05165 [Puccinia triticina 1-1 BBBD Race 1]
MDAEKGWRLTGEIFFGAVAGLVPGWRLGAAGQWLGPAGGIWSRGISDGGGGRGYGIWSRAKRLEDEKNWKNTGGGAEAKNFVCRIFSLAHPQAFLVLLYMAHRPSLSSRVKKRHQPNILRRAPPPLHELIPKETPPAVYHAKPTSTRQLLPAQQHTKPNCLPIPETTSPDDRILQCYTPHWPCQNPYVAHMLGPGTRRPQPTPRSHHAPPIMHVQPNKPPLAGRPTQLSPLPRQRPNHSGAGVGSGEGDTAIIKQQQAKAHKEGGAAGGEQYTIVYLPPHFQARMAVYVVVIIPLLLDRVFLANHPKPNDVYAYALGALRCAIGLLLVARAWAAYARLFSQPTGGAQPDEWGVAKPKDVLDDDVWLRRPIRSPLLWTRSLFDGAPATWPAPSARSTLAFWSLSAADCC